MEPLPLPPPRGNPNPDPKDIWRHFGPKDENAARKEAVQKQLEWAKKTFLQKAWEKLKIIPIGLGHAVYLSFLLSLVIDAIRCVNNMMTPWGSKEVPEDFVTGHLFSAMWWMAKAGFNSTIKSMQMIAQMDISNNIMAPLIVGAISAGAAWVFRGARVKKEVEKIANSAPQKFVRELDKLIERGVAEGVEAAAINARAIVSARNEMRKSLLSISQQLNSEIDVLAEQTGMPFDKLQHYSENNNQSGNAEQLYQTIQVLSRVWPARKTQIEFAVAKVLVEMGFPVSTKSKE